MICHKLQETEQKTMATPNYTKQSKRLMSYLTQNV